MKKIGIWGLGVVGTSVIRFLHGRGHSLAVLDSRQLSNDEKAFLLEHQITYYSQAQEEDFFAACDVIIPSPGIAISGSPHLAKMKYELDFFSPEWHKPLIAVTGSLGKTTLVTLLDQILSANNLTVATGGNIGLPMLDLLTEQDEADYGLLELSSFQLEYAQPFAPTLAVLTNLYANHLDRHGTLDNYLKAKCKILSLQRPDQRALVPFSLAPKIRFYTDNPLTFFAREAMPQELTALRSEEILYTYDNHKIIRIKKTDAATLKTTHLNLSSHVLKNLTGVLAETRLCMIAACDMLGILSSESFHIPQLPTLEHRIEYLGEHQGIQFYNDSKSTIMQATQAALSTLAPQKIHLLLGGKSKGVNRAPFISEIKTSVTSIACFGEEAEALHKSSQELGIASTSHKTLDDALQSSLAAAQPGDAILLSPGGSSYDLYEIYIERGNHFKKLVKEL